MENTENRREEKLLWHKPEVQKLIVNIDTANSISANAVSDLASV